MASAGRWPPHARRAPRSPTWRFEWLRYVEQDRKGRPSTIQGYRSVLQSRLLPEFGELSVESITADMLDDYRVRLVGEETLSARSVNKLLVQLHAIFKRAQRSKRSRAPPSPSKTRRSSPPRRSRGCAWVNCERSGGATWTSPPDVCTFVATTRRARSATRSRARCARCR